MKNKIKTVAKIPLPKSQRDYYPKVMKNPNRFGFIWDTTYYNLDD